MCHWRPTVRGLRHPVQTPQDRVVVTKDRDLRDSHPLQSTPKRLLLVLRGITSDAALLALFETYGTAMAAAPQESDIVEVGPDALVQHPRP